MNEPNTPEAIWEREIIQQNSQLKTAAYCILNNEGTLTYANELMCLFLNTTPHDLLPINQLINPSFDQIKTFESKSHLIFEGILTIGNHFDVSYDLDAKIFKNDDSFLLFCEPNILNLFQENQKMSDLNQEVNNLHRQLIKEKSKLQHTLAELRDTQQLLIHSEKMNALGQMVAGIAHEINNPIAFVTNNLYELDKSTAELIGAYKQLENACKKNGNDTLSATIKNLRSKNEIDFLEEDITEMLTDSKSGVERVKKIVQDLRNFSRLDESERKQIDLIENIQSTLSIVNAEIQKKNIDFKLIANEKVMLDCFPGQLNQAILNVLINAIQAVSNNGKITLSIQEFEKTLEIRVKDNGTGIKPESIEKIFNPFYTTKPIGTGTGLGLSITYKIINDLHKGKISVESEENKGTVFIFTLPKMASV